MYKHHDENFFSHAQTPTKIRTAEQIAATLIEKAGT
jgi:hypothetical protein